METLMLMSEDRAVPYAYQVPKPVYEKFKHYQDVTLVHLQPVISMIDAACSVHKQLLMASIEKWKTKTLKELELHERREKAETLAGSIFA